MFCMDYDINIILLLNLVFLMTWTYESGCKCSVLIPITR